MAAFSTLLGSGNALVAAFRGKNFSLDLRTISLGMPASTRKRRTRAKAREAVATASRESMIDPAASLSLHPLCRDQSAVAAAAAVLDCRRTEEDEERRKENVNVTAEKMDLWIKESIGEIVRNIGEAPFLVQIFSQGPSAVRLEREEASPESWPLVKKKWNQTSCIPDGIILVEELVEELIDNVKEDASNDNNGDGSESQTWGLVVQGRGMECAAPCYILNTCRVRSAAGFCTHFCLVRARCFGENLDKQISRAWLQGR